MPTLADLPSSPWRPLSGADATRVAAVVTHLVSRLDFVTDWRLQKAYFLAEVRSIEERLCRLSAADFASWMHGPWSLHVREAAEVLEADEVLQRVVRPALRRPEAEFLRVTNTRKIAYVGDVEGGFLDLVSKEIKYLNGEALTNLAKNTTPFRVTSPRERIDLDHYLESMKEKHARFARSPKVASLVAEAKAE